MIKIRKKVIEKYIIRNCFFFVCGRFSSFGGFVEDNVII